MKHYKKLNIRGISTRVFVLILVTVFLVSAAYSGLSLYNRRMLARMTQDSVDRQRAAIAEDTHAVMDAVIQRYMDRTTQLQATLADEQFYDLKNRVLQMAHFTEKLLRNADKVPRQECLPPDPANNGTLVTQLILAPDADPESPELIDRVGLMANMNDMTTSMFGNSSLTNSFMIALTNGAFLVMDDQSSNKFNPDGTPLVYDARLQPWYQEAAETGQLIFSDVETDIFTGKKDVVCAMPVYVNGELQAVVGSDIFLTSIQEAVQTSEEYGGFLAVVNEAGHVIFSPRTEGVFQVLPGNQAPDLRESDCEGLGALVADALNEKTDVRLITLPDGAFYAVGAPMKTVGWAMIYLFSEEMSSRPAASLLRTYDTIQNEAIAGYLEQSGRHHTTALIILAALSLIMLTGALLLGRRIVHPLNRITEKIASLPEDHPVFVMEDTFRTGDEIQVLAESFASLSQQTMDYVEQVKTVTAEKERIGAELSLAKQIQAAMLPHIFPPFPDRHDFDIYAKMDPAKEVGGDFYDYFLIDEDHICLVIADVSGKGIPAALFMMVSKIILQSCAMLGKSVAEILTKTNEAICSNNEAQMFVTVWVGILELSTGRLTAANAGHEYPALMRAGGAFEIFKDKHGFVIGGLDGAVYKEYELTLNPGDKLFLYTDGVTEATNAQEELFGSERMLAALNVQPKGSSEEILTNVRRAVDGFVGDAPQFDDLTMLCIEYKGPQPQKGDTQP